MNAVGGPSEFMWHCGCIHRLYQARKDLHTGTVKINPQKILINDIKDLVIYLRFIKNIYFYEVKQKKWK